MSATRRVAIAAGAVVTVAALAVLALNLAGDSVPAEPLFRIAPSTFSRTVTADGTFKAVDSTPVSAPVGIRRPMRIAWLTDDGKHVEKGDLLARLDASELESEMKDGRVMWETAANRIRKEDSDWTATRENLGRDAEQATRELVAARSFPRRDDDVFSRYQIIESDIDENLAERKRDHADDLKEIRGRVAAAQRQLVEIEQKKAGLKIDQAKSGLASLEIRAEHAGTFTLRRVYGETLRVGDRVWSGLSIGELPDLAKMEAETWVLEADAGGLAPGEPADVWLESNPRRTYAAKVRSVAPIAKPHVQGSPVQYFDVTLELEKTDPAVMKPGTRLRARIHLERRNAAIAIPRQAVFEKKGKKIVYRRSDQGFEPVEVTIQSTSPGRVVITKGLKSGDVIALREPEKTE
ncbi:MAG: HlyD family efflux transporter periplasmic adaptor subunit [Thermoanaerobaculia bacterium]